MILRLLIITLLFNTGFIEQSNVHIQENQECINYVESVFDLINANDFETINEYASEDGVYSLTQFDDKRNSDRLLLINKGEIRDDLVLIDSSSNKVGITLDTWANILDNEITVVYVSDEELVLDFNHDRQDRGSIEKKISSIRKKCQTLIEISNEFKPRIYNVNNQQFFVCYK